MTDSAPSSSDGKEKKVRIRVRRDGPLVVDGLEWLDLVDADGEAIPCPPSPKGNIALCRCGASANKPFCDGSHRESNCQE